MASPDTIAETMAETVQPVADPFAGYELGAAYDEMIARGGEPRAHYRPLHDRLRGLDAEDLRRRKAMTDLSMRQDGVGFTVYRADEGIERVWPMDPVPRILTTSEWDKIERGVIQRVKALNLFLWDVYHDRKILKDGVVPSDLVLSNANYRPEMIGLDPPQGTYIHINGTDIVRDRQGSFLVLEDNGRSPSGVSYVVENRHLMQRAFPDLLQGLKIRPVSDYGKQLLRKLTEVAPAGVSSPNVVLLSPGIYNSAYF